MEATGNEKSFDLEQLMEFSKALKDYKNTGVKQCLSILQSLLESNTTLNQLKESKLGATLSKIAKEEFTEPEEKQIKEEAIKVFKRCKAREAANPLPAAPVADGEKAAEKPASNGNKPAEREEKKPVEERKEERPRKEEEKPRKEEERPRKEEERRGRDEERPRKEEERPRKEERPSASDVFGSADSDAVPKRNNNVPPKREPAREHAREPERKKESVGKGTPSGGVPFLPNLEPQYRNFSLKSFSEGLLMDYKTNPAEKEKMRPTAYKKAVEIERALMEKVRGNENEYRLLARDLSTFLMMKTNLELRNYIMVNDGDCKEFVNNKENFMNTAAREKIEKTSRRLIDAANADYDKKTIRESALYQCKNCKSKRITKTEKQTRSGDEPMTSFFQCVDCGKGWKEG